MIGGALPLTLALIGAGVFAFGVYQKGAADANARCAAAQVEVLEAGRKLESDVLQTYDDIGGEFDGGDIDQRLRDPSAAYFASRPRNMPASDGD